MQEFSFDRMIRSQQPAGARPADGEGLQLHMPPQIELGGTLKMACTLFPGVGKLANNAATSHLGRKHDPQPDDFVLVVRAMHLPKNASVQLGTRFEKLQAAGGKRD